jgi:hypothetical protein
MVNVRELNNPMAGVCLCQAWAANFDPFWLKELGISGYGQKRCE